MNINLKNSICTVSLISLATLSGCSSDNNMMSKAVKNLALTASILNDSKPLIKESNDWEQYSVEAAKSGLKYSLPSSNDKAFVENKMNTEFPEAIARVASPFVRDSASQQEMQRVNQGYIFKYHEIQVVNNHSNSTIGYCVSYDYENKLQSQKDNKNQIIYVSKDTKKLSVTTSNEDTMKNLCGDHFYKKHSK